MKLLNPLSLSRLIFKPLYLPRRPSLASSFLQEWLEREALETKLIMQVHDELVLEVPDRELPRVREALPGIMSGVAELAVPLVVEMGVGANWDKAH